MLNQLKGKVNMSTQTNILKKALLECFIKITLCTAIISSICYGIYYSFSLMQNLITIDGGYFLSDFITFFAQQSYLSYIPVIPLFFIFLCNCTIYKISKNKSIKDDYLCNIHKRFKNIQKSMNLMTPILFGLFLASKIVYLNDISNSENIDLNSFHFISAFFVFFIISFVLFSFIFMLTDDIIFNKTRLKKYDSNKVKIKTK